MTASSSQPGGAVHGESAFTSRARSSQHRFLPSESGPQQSRKELPRCRTLEASLLNPRQRAPRRSSDRERRASALAFTAYRCLVLRRGLCRLFHGGRDRHHRIATTQHLAAARRRAEDPRDRDLRACRVISWRNNAVICGMVRFWNAVNLDAAHRRSAGGPGRNSIKSACSTACCAKWTWCQQSPIAKPLRYAAAGDCVKVARKSFVVAIRRNDASIESCFDL